MNQTIVQQLAEQVRVSRKLGLTGEVTFLSTLLAEIQAVGKNAANRESTDDEAIAVIRKFIKNNEETLAIKTTPDSVYDKLNWELTILRQFLPEQVSDDELRAMILEEVDQMVTDSNPLSMKLVGRLTKIALSRYPGAVEPKRIAEIVRELMSV